MTIIDGDTLKEAYKNAANIDDREKETAYKMIDQQIEAQKEKFDMLVYDPVATVRMEVAMQGYGLMKLIHDSDIVVRDCVEKQLRKRAAEQNLPEPKFSRPKSKGRSR